MHKEHPALKSVRHTELNTGKGWKRIHKEQKSKEMGTTERLVTNEVEREHKNNVREFRFIEGTKAVRGGPLMVAQWLRYCATNRKVAGSIPDGVNGIFH
jgi:hypothetical protein